MGGRSGNPKILGRVFGFLEFRVLKNDTRILSEIKKTRHFGYPKIWVRVRVTRTTRLLSVQVDHSEKAAHGDAGAATVACTGGAERFIASQTHLWAPWRLGVDLPPLPDECGI